MAALTEDHIEQIALDYLQRLGYKWLYGPNISPDGEQKEREYNEVVLVDRLRAAIDRINPDKSADIKEEGLRKLLRSVSPGLLANNEHFHKLITEGVDVEYRLGDRIVYDKLQVIDFQNEDNNEFVAVNQFTVIEGYYNRRPDIVLFINGLPLVIIELKNATDESATVKTAFKQLQTYKDQISSLFLYNSLLIASDGWDAKCGTITSDWSRFHAWKTKDGSTTADSLTPQLEVMCMDMLKKDTLLDIIRHFIVFEATKKETVKKVAAYHQYYAVNKAVSTTLKAASSGGDCKAGVVWHTQGSGKSLSMVFYTGKLVLQMDNPTIVLLTDRNDLDDQLFETFSNCNQLLRQMPVQSESRTDIQKLLKVSSGGIVFTTIQKFMPEPINKIELPNGKKKFIYGDYPELSVRRNIVVIADEAHRSQYDFIDGLAKHLRDALPKASFIGFTGTPIESEDKNTQSVFGDYIDVYDIEQAVQDGATVRIFYESRLAKVVFKEEEKVKLDDAFEDITEGEELTERQKIKSRWTRIEAVVGHEQRVSKIAEDLVKHFDQRSEVQEGKAMIVCMSRRICVELYDAIVKLRPRWHKQEDDKGEIKVIMTGSASETEWKDHIRSKKRRKDIGERLKNPVDPLKIVIVRDMWLTGFDAPCLHTLYIDKPMSGHNLMQAIARVNRVFKDKDGGLVVDYIGIAQELKYALAQYSASGGKGKPTFDIEEAVATMMDYYEVVQQLFDGFDYKVFFSLTPEEKFRFLPQAADFIFSLEEGQDRFTQNVTSLLKSFALAVPHEQALAIRDDVAFFQAVKTRISKVTYSQKSKSDEELETAIKQIVSSAISSDEVIDIFDAAGIKKPRLDILDEVFLQEIMNMPLKNMAAELLKRLLRDAIKKRGKINLVQSRKFSEMLEDAIKRYHNGMIDTVEFIEKYLIPMAREMREADKRGEVLNLDYRELAFYDALGVSDSAVAVLGDETLKTIARELLESVRSNVTIDWTIKESVQANLRRFIRRILRKYNYPPEKTENAVQTVLEQAKLLANDFSNQAEKDRL
jgi:type I restriction enzyme R subunit